MTISYLGERKLKKKNNELLFLYREILNRPGRLCHWEQASFASGERSFQSIVQYKLSLTRYVTLKIKIIKFEFSTEYR